MIAELIGARIVVFNVESSNLCEMGAKSLVKPAKMFMLRLLPITSERMTVLPSAGGDVDGESEGGAGIAGPRLEPDIGACCFRESAVTARVAVSVGIVK